jgi:hypothetical protein
MPPPGPQAPKVEPLVHLIQEVRQTLQAYGRYPCGYISPEELVAVADVLAAPCTDPVPEDGIVLARRQGTVARLTSGSRRSMLPKLHYNAGESARIRRPYYAAHFIYALWRQNDRI